MVMMGVAIRHSIKITATTVMATSLVQVDTPSLCGTVIVVVGGIPNMKIEIKNHVIVKLNRSRTSRVS